MSGSELTLERLAGLGSLPQLIERALRAGLRESVLSRDSAGLRRTPPRHPALAEFDRLAGPLPLGAANRVAARSRILAHAVGFTHSRLGRRLAALGPARVSAAADEMFDLVVQARSGRRFVVRFAAPRGGLAAAGLAADIARHACFADGVVVYDLERQTCRYYPRPLAGLELGAHLYAS